MGRNFFWLNSLVNPALYFYRNKRYRKAAPRLFKFGKPWEIRPAVQIGRRKTRHRDSFTSVNVKELIHTERVQHFTRFKQMKIITVYTQLKQLRNKAWKKFRPERESNPWPLRYRCSALTNWAIKPTGSWSIVSSLNELAWSGLISQLLKLSIYCDDLHLLKMYFPKYKYMTFMYSYHNFTRSHSGSGHTHKPWSTDHAWRT